MGTGTVRTARRRQCTSPATSTAEDPTDDPFRHRPQLSPAVTDDSIQADNVNMDSPDAAAWGIARQLGTSGGLGSWPGRLRRCTPKPRQQPADPGDLEWSPSRTRTAWSPTVTMPRCGRTRGTTAIPTTTHSPPPSRPSSEATWGRAGRPSRTAISSTIARTACTTSGSTRAGTDPNDKLVMQFDLTVPPGVKGYVFDFAYFSGEWPVYVDQAYNDLFITWSTSESFTGNVTFVNNAPLTVTSRLHHANAFRTHGQRSRAGRHRFRGARGERAGSSPRARPSPTSSSRSTFFIADMGDAWLATAALIDNFRWDCKGCIPSGGRRLRTSTPVGRRPAGP